MFIELQALKILRSSGAKCRVRRLVYRDIALRWSAKLARRAPYKQLAPLEPEEQFCSATLTLRFCQNVRQRRFQLRVTKLKSLAYEALRTHALATQQQGFTHLPKQ